MPKIVRHDLQAENGVVQGINTVLVNRELETELRRIGEVSSQLVIEDFELDVDLPENAEGTLLETALD